MDKLTLKCFNRFFLKVPLFHLKFAFNRICNEINIPLDVSPLEEEVLRGSAPVTLHASQASGERMMATLLSPRLDLALFNP